MQTAAPSSKHISETLTPAQQRLLSASQANGSSRVEGTTSSPGHPAQSRRQLLTGTTAGITGACMCGVCGPTPVARAIEEWDYRRTGTGWGGMCGKGQYQSPIDFKFTTSEPQTFFASSAGDTGKSRLSNAYKRVSPRFAETSECVVTNAGHGTMQVNFPDGACNTMIDGKMRNLVQFHFHAPSEHTLNGRRFAMEAHLVHKEPESGEFSVLGVMIARDERAPSNPCLRAALDMAPQPTKKTNGCTFDPNHLLPPSVRDGRPSFIHYTGSLTTPPCTEGIKWYVYTDPLYVNDDEVLDFIEFVGGGKPDFNARPIQVLSDREWSYFLDSCNCQLTYRSAKSGGEA